ncbi:hypothetical protein [Nocardia sp. NPDC019395]|uniref:hypothetical protein n=1 Tax=Nocardia sp. NPDC019395 TaxID=3154686 RepID=UPI0033E24166
MSTVIAVDFLYPSARLTNAGTNPDQGHKVLDLAAAGRPVAQVAADLGISDETICVRRKQELIDTGRIPGATSTEQSVLIAAERSLSLADRAVSHRPVYVAAGL